MKFITMSVAVLLGSALNAATAQQLGGSREALPTKTEAPKGQPMLTDGSTNVDPQSYPGGTQFVGNADACGAAKAIVGPGPFAYNTTAATTGAEGQANGICLFFGTDDIEEDVWFTWTAGASGSTTLTNCGLGSTHPDSKIAIYNGAGCPGAAAIACNDDACESLRSSVTWNAIGGNQYTIQIGSFPGTAVPGTGSFSINTIVGCPGAHTNNCCATPTVYPGGVFPWNNVGDTTDGGAESCGNPQQDIWYSWTADCTGIATFSLCPGGELNPDTVIAAYAGVGCPTPGTAIGCDDDTCSSPAFGTSRCTFNVTAGNPYILRIGGFGGTTGSGNFEVTCFTPPPPGPCDVFDDGSTENSVGTNNPAHDILWIHSQGEPTGSTIVNSISTAWGSLQFGGATNGSPARVGIWSDPNGDGNPTDAVLLQSVNTVVAGANTDAFQTVPLAPPVFVSGKYFIGASCTGGTFPAPLDQSSGPGAGRVWIVGSTVGAINYSNLAGEEIPPLDEDQVAPGFWLLRGSCKDQVTAFCEGDTGCPCANNNDGSNPVDGGVAGCANSVFPGGANLDTSGNASISNDTLSLIVTDQKSGALTLFWQGSTENPPVFNGDGLRCVNSLKRLYRVKDAHATSVTAPGDAVEQDSITVRSAALGDPLSVGSVRGYYASYRDNTLSFCPSPVGSTFNNTNALRIVWGP